MTIVWVIAGGLVVIALMAAAFIAGVCVEHYRSGPVTMRFVCDPRRFTSPGSQGVCQCGKAVKRSRGQIRRHARLLSSE